MSKSAVLKKSYRKVGKLREKAEKAEAAGHYRRARKMRRRSERHKRRVERRTGKTWEEAVAARKKYEAKKANPPSRFGRRILRTE